MKYPTFFFRKLGKMSQNLSSAAVVIGALRVKHMLWVLIEMVLLSTHNIYVLDED